jgi:hypothetical protein
MELDLSEGSSSGSTEENKNELPPASSTTLSTFEQLKDHVHGGNKHLYCLLEQVFRSGGRESILLKTFGRELIDKFLSSVGHKSVSHLPTNHV